MRILVAEDEPKVAEALREGLAAQGYEVAVERTGEDAFFRLNTETFDLILLDLARSGRGGMEVLGAIRATTVGLHVLMAAVRSKLVDNIIEVHVGRLRRKVDVDQEGRLIRTIRGVGYILNDGEP